MRRLVCASALCVLLPIIALGQETPKVELFGGYSYLRGKGTTIPFRADENTDMHGWNISVARNVNDWFGLVADFSGHYSERISRFGNSGGEFTSRTNKNMHLFLFGPRFTLDKNKRISPFAHSLFGVALARTKIEDRFEQQTPFKASNLDAGFAAAFGVGLDIKLSKKIALRLVQADYVLTKLDSRDFKRENRDNLRLSTGISFRFGK
jgi:opacity protein-like surface antigen